MKLCIFRGQPCFVLALCGDVLEAKLVTDNRFCISLTTTRLENNQDTQLRPDKQTNKNKCSILTHLIDLDLGTHLLSWVKWEEPCNSLTWITSIKISNADMGAELQRIGRLRWKIENEGFNTQKNLGYNLEHKYSRISFNTTRNYYQCMQIAHLIEQITRLSKQIKELLASGRTSVVKMRERLLNMLVFCLIDIKPLERLLEQRCQIRFS